MPTQRRLDEEGMLAIADLMDMGFDDEQIDYLLQAEELCEQGYSPEEIQEELGYGIVDAALLEDTFGK